MSEVDLIQLEWKKFTQKNIYSFLETINKERVKPFDISSYCKCLF